MIMETISCGYPVAPSGLGTAPISPPATPTGTENYAPQLYAQTPYVTPSYSTSPVHSTFSKYDEDANNNNHIYNASDNLNNNNNNDQDSILSDLSSLSITESDERYSDLSPVSGSPDYVCQSPCSPPSVSSSQSKSKKNSRSRSKSSVPSQEEDKSRKDSFVYDVRLPDEQILFFVPDLDLVKSHLMFAVREEVDVLKDRIVELMDRIKHLECENTILRQYASPEVLQQLQSQMPHQLQQQQQQQQPPHHTSTS